MPLMGTIAEVTLKVAPRSEVLQTPRGGSSRAVPGAPVIHVRAPDRDRREPPPAGLRFTDQTEKRVADWPLRPRGGRRASANHSARCVMKGTEEY
ncbi:unnamed protein product [Arctogadus glacialis]